MQRWLLRPAICQSTEKIHGPLPNSCEAPGSCHPCCRPTGQRAQPRNQIATNYSVLPSQNLTEAGGSPEVQNQPRLCSEFQARLGYTASCLQPLHSQSRSRSPAFQVQSLPGLSRDSRLKGRPKQKEVNPSASIFFISTCSPLQNLGLPWLQGPLGWRAGLLRLPATHWEAS